jgi:hypothetical protein
VGVAVAIDQAWLAIQEEKHSRFLRFRNMFLCCCSALAIASPWIVFTIVSTGDIIPVSGRAVYQVTNVVFNHLLNQDLSSFPLMMFKYFKEDFLIYQPLGTLSKNTFWQVFIVLLSLVGCIVALQDRKLRVLFRSVWLFQVLLLFSYIFIIGGFWHLNRYLYPVYTLILLLHASTLHYLESRIKLKSWIVALVLVILFVPFASSYTFQYHFHWSKNLPPRYLSASLFAKERIPPKARVGTFQSGCLGYWLDNTVINLDGVINEDAYLHLKDKTMDSYLVEQKIDYIVEEVYLFNMWDNYLEGQLSKHFKLVTLRKEKKLRRWPWHRLGIYKRK